MYPDRLALPQPICSCSEEVAKKSVHSKVRVIVRGYGPFREFNKLLIATNLGDFGCKFQRRPYYANWFHALDELEVEDANYSNLESRLRFLRRLKRSISIGISRRNHMAGILCGFKATADVPTNINFLKLRLENRGTLFVSRTASKSGLVLSDFSKEMERSIRRGARENDFFITNVSTMAPKYGTEPYLNSFPNLMPGIKAVEVNDEDYKKSSNSLPPPKAVNHYQRILNASVTPQGVVSAKTSSGMIKIINLKISEFWPSSIWKSPVSQEILTPTVSGSTQVKEPASFIECSANWAHFVEDNLPSILGLIQQDKLRPIYISGCISDIQKEALKELFPESCFVFMNIDWKYEFDDLIINIHQDSRNSMIEGIQSYSEMVDFKNLQTIRSLAISKIADESLGEIKIFISRNGGFRTLINKEKVQSIFQDNGYLIISAETLGFLERIKLFQRATVVAGETGAGLVNLYFCKAGTRVIELRHPANKKSLEQLALLRLTDHKYHIIHGRSVGPLKKLHYGVDAFFIDERDVFNALN